MNMPRLKMPAYGKALMENRQRGFHPLEISLWYGDDWKMPQRVAAAERAEFVRLGRAARPYSPEWEKAVGKPMLAIRPRDYAPAVFDFRGVVGARVTVFDPEWAGADFDVDAAGTITRWGLFYDLLGEVAAHAAMVMLEPTVFEQKSAGAIAATYRAVDPASGTLAYPRWWSSQLSGHAIDAWRGWRADVDAMKRNAESACVENG
jgi:hypothetical protein